MFVLQVITCPAGPLMPLAGVPGYILDSFMACCSCSFRRWVLSQWWPSFSSILSTPTHGCCRSAWMFFTRKRVNATGQPSGAYSRQLSRGFLTNNDGTGGFDGDDAMLADPCWLLDARCTGMVTPSWAPKNAIASTSADICPQFGSTLRPSAKLPAVNPTDRNSWWCAAPDFSANKESVLLRTPLSGIRYMAQAGMTASRITSYRAWGGQNACYNR